MAVESESAHNQIAQEHVDVTTLDRVLHDFLQRHSVGWAIAIDGKTLRGSGHRAERPRHLMATVIHQTGVVVGQSAVDQKPNEIKVARSRLGLPTWWSTW